VDERSAEIGEMVSGRRRQRRFLPYLIITFWPIHNVPRNLHANSFRDICITSTN